MSKAFQKFINVAPGGAKKKENHKQEKRAVKKERAAYFDNIKAEKKKAYLEAKANRTFFDENKRGIKATSTAPVSNTSRASTTKAFNPSTKNTGSRTAPKKQFDETAKYNPAAGRKSFFKTKETIAKEKEEHFATYTVRDNSPKGLNSTAKPAPTKPTAAKVATTPKQITQQRTPRVQKPFVAPAALNKPVTVAKKAMDAEMPLNKYIAHCGVCSRRDAVAIIKQGKITVGKTIATEPGYKVLPTDVIKLDGKIITPQNNLVYILLNKPKDFLTTADDPQGRKTVMDLIGNATPERVYPIGRLDRNTTGVLLFTNDGDLAQKLTHPKHGVKKIYEVRLDKPLTKTDAEKILAGIQLEDGLIIPDALAFVDNTDRSLIGIEIHSGRNRIVRRIFEHMGYDVRNLDRVMFANLTKKNVERGRYRFLNEKEIRSLKFLNSSKTDNTNSN